MIFKVARVRKLRWKRFLAGSGSGRVLRARRTLSGNHFRLGKFRMLRSPNSLPVKDCFRRKPMVSGRNRGFRTRRWFSGPRRVRKWWSFRWRKTFRGPVLGIFNRLISRLLLVLRFLVFRNNQLKFLLWVIKFQLKRLNCLDPRVNRVFIKFAVRFGRFPRNSGARGFVLLMIRARVKLLSRLFPRRIRKLMIGQSSWRRRRVLFWRRVIGSRKHSVPFLSLKFRLIMVINVLRVVFLLKPLIYNFRLPLVTFRHIVILNFRKWRIGSVRRLMKFRILKMLRLSNSRLRVSPKFSPVPFQLVFLRKIVLLSRG